MSKSIVISLRIKPEHMAKAIDGLLAFDQEAPVDRLSDIVRQTFEHGLNYLTYDMPIPASKASRERIKQLTNQKQFRPNKPKQILGQPISGRQMVREIKTRPPEISLRAMEQALDQAGYMNNQTKEQSNEQTESEINTVTDFNPSGLTPNEEEEE